MVSVNKVIIHSAGSFVLNWLQLQQDKSINLKKKRQRMMMSKSKYDSVWVWLKGLLPDAPLSTLRVQVEVAASLPTSTGSCLIGFQTPTRPPRSEDSASATEPNLAAANTVWWVSSNGPLEPSHSLSVKVWMNTWKPLQSVCVCVRVDSCEAVLFGWKRDEEVWKVGKAQK